MLLLCFPLTLLGLWGFFNFSCAVDCDFEEGIINCLRIDMSVSRDTGEETTVVSCRFGAESLFV